MLINPYYSEGYGYPGLGMVNPYYSEGYGYSNLGLGIISPGKAFTAAEQKRAVAYNTRKAKSVGWEAAVSGTPLARAVYAAQSLLFSDAKERDGKLGPNTKGAFKAALQTTSVTPSPAAIQAAIDGIVGGKDASQQTVSGRDIVAAIGFKSRQPARRTDPPRPPTPTPGPPSVIGPPAQAGIGGGMIMGLVLIGAAVWFWTKK